MRTFRVFVAAAAGRILNPLVPRGRMLPFRYWLSRVDGSCETELRYLHRIIGPARVALDIGANKGWYTYKLSKLFESVYAFEINDEITGWIEHYNRGNIKLIHCGLSSRADRVTFYVPVLRGLILDGWGSLDRDNVRDATAYREKDVQTAALDQFRIIDVNFIKIDVEGHEAEVLKGGIETISKWRPTVLIEVRDANLGRVDSWFEKLHYRRYKLDNLVGRKGSRENYIYLPNERLGSVAAGAR
jgi:FkbM family methyltransferase